jgi:hypothetical protein
MEEQMWVGGRLDLPGPAGPLVRTPPSYSKMAAQLLLGLLAML